MIKNKEQLLEDEIRYAFPESSFSKVNRERYITKEFHVKICKL